MSTPHSTFADATELFATQAFISHLADAVEENVRKGDLPKDIIVAVDGDNLVKFSGDNFTVSCTKVIDDVPIFVVQIACSPSLRAKLKEYHTLEFIHKRLPEFFSTSAEQPDSEHNVHDMLKAATLVQGRTILTSTYREPIALLAANEQDHHRAVRRLKLVEAEFEDKTIVLVGEDFLSTLKSALRGSEIEGITISVDDLGNNYIKWETGEVHFLKDDPGIYTVDFYTQAELASLTRTILRSQYIQDTLAPYLRNLLDDNAATQEVLEGLRKIALAVPTDPESISEPFFFLYANPADEATILEHHMNSHHKSEANNNNNDKPTADAIREAAGDAVDTAKSGIDRAAEAIGSAAEKVNDAVHDAREHVAEALLKEPTFFDRATQFTKDHARDMVFGAIGFAVGVVATTIIKR